MTDLKVGEDWKTSTIPVTLEQVLSPTEAKKLQINAFFIFLGKSSLGGYSFMWASICLSRIYLK